MKAVLYARVSSKEQEKEGFSIPAQEKLLREYAHKNNIKVVKEFTDVETAKTAGRTQFGKMVEYLHNNREVRIILVEKTDRLYRNFRDYVLLEDLDLEIHLVKENETISKDSRSHSKFIHGIKLLMAKNYIDNLSEEVKKGMKEKAEQGRWPAQAPFGYTNNKTIHTIEVDPKTAPFVMRMYELYATGEYSLSSLCKFLKAEGVKSRNGHYLAKGVIEPILKNPFYYGEFIWNGKQYPGVHEPLITRDLYNKVQRILRRPGKPKSRKGDFAFTGLLKCGRCGCQITAEKKKGKYIYYHCTGGKGKCNQPYIKEEDLDEKFADIVKAIQTEKDVVDWIKSTLKDSYQEEKEFHEKEVKRLNTKYNNLQSRINKAYEDRLDGIIDDGYWLDVSAKWRSEQDRIKGLIERYENANRNYLDQGSQILELAQDAYFQYVRKEPIEKRRLLNYLLSNCTLDNLTLYPTYKKPFNFIAECTKLKEKLPRQDSNLRPAD